MSVITRTPIIDDDGSGTTGTVIDNAWKQELYDQIDLVASAAIPEVIGGTTTGTVTDWVIPGRTSRHAVMMWTGTATLGIHGISALALAPGEMLTIKNASTSAIILLHHQSATNPTPGLRLVLSVTSGPTPIAPGGWATLIYAGGWNLTNHDQGAAITAPFSAANFASSGGTWTVDAGDVSALTYVVRGRMLLVSVDIQTATTGGAPVALLLLNGAYGGYTGASTCYRFSTVYTNLTGPNELGYAYIAPPPGGNGLDRIAFYRVTGLWPAVTNTLYLRGAIELDVA